MTFYLLFAMRLSTRTVQFLGSTTNPGGPWMEQIARNLTDAFDGFLREPIRYVLMDRDTKFTAKFQEILRSAEVHPVLLPPKSPNCNAYIERFFRSLKSEATSKMIFFGEKALLNAVREFLVHYHGERVHQGLGHRFWEAGPVAGRSDGVIECRERLGGCSNIITGERRDCRRGIRKFGSRNGSNREERRGPFCLRGCR